MPTLTMPEEDQREETGESNSGPQPGSSSGQSQGGNSANHSGFNASSLIKNGDHPGNGHNSNPTAATSPGQNIAGGTAGAAKPAAEGAAKVAEKAAASTPATRLATAAMAVGSFTSGHKKGLAGGGVIALIITMIIASFLALLPLKIESMMKNIFEKRIGEKVERVVELRTERLLEAYIEKGVLTAGGHDTAIVTTANPLTDFYRTMRVNKFLDKLEADQGITFEKGAKFGTLDVYKDGELVGNLGSHEGRAYLGSVVDDQLDTINVLQRHNLRVWLRNVYNIQKWKFFSGEEDPAKADEEVIDTTVGNANAVADAEDVAIVTCPVEPQSCPNDSESNPAGTDATAEGDATSAVTDAASGADDAGAQAVKTATAEAQKTGAKLSTKALQTVFGKALGAQISEVIDKVAGPVAIIGLFDVGARLDNFFYSGQADKALVAAHKAEYVADFTQWETISSSIKEGSVTGAEFNAVMNLTNGSGTPGTSDYTPGIEGSAAFNDLYLNKSGGVPLVGQTTGDVLSKSINEQATPVADFYKKYIGNLPAPCSPPSVHGCFLFWDYTGKHVMDIVNHALAFVVSLVEKIFPPIQWAMNAIAGLLVHVITLIITPAVTGLETGADLMNALDAGGSVVGQGFMSYMGAPQVSGGTSAVINQEIASEQAQQAARLPLSTRIFSTDYTNSAVNQLALAVPNSAGAAINGGISATLAVIGNPIKWLEGLFSGLGLPFIGGAHAASNINLYGLNQYDFTDAQLDQPVDLGAMQQAAQNAATRLSIPVSQVGVDQLTPEDCPASPANAPNMCQADVVTMQSDIGTLTTTDDAGIGDTSNATGTGPANNSSSSTSSASASTLAQEILGNSKITESGRDVKQDLQDAANGQNGTAGVPTSSKILQLIDTLGESHSLDISAIQSGGTGHCNNTPKSACPNDPHYQGDAVDIDQLDGTAITGRNQPALTIISTALNILPPGMGTDGIESGFGQSGCGTTPPLPTGFITFPDTCNHLHVQVAGGTP